MDFLKSLRNTRGSSDEDEEEKSEEETSKEKTSEEETSKPLWQLCFEGQLEEARLALRGGEDVNSKDGREQTALKF